MFKVDGGMCGHWIRGDASAEEISQVRRRSQASTLKLGGARGCVVGLKDAVPGLQSVHEDGNLSYEDALCNDSLTCEISSVTCTATEQGRYGRPGRNLVPSPGHRRGRKEGHGPGVKKER